MASAKNLLTLLAAGILIGAFVFFAKETFQTNINISFAPHSEMLNQVLQRKLKEDLSEQLESYAQKSIWSVPLESILHSIQSDSRVENVTVRRQFPNRVELQVHPVKPQLLLLGRKGKFHPVAKDGRLMPPLLVGESPNLPILRGLNFFKEKQTRKDLVQIYLKLPESGRFSRAQISEIRRNSKKETTLFLNEFGHQVVVSKKLDESLVARVEQVLSYLESRSIKSRVIDARFSKKVVVRVRNAP